MIPPSSFDPASGEVLAERIDPCDRLLHTERPTTTTRSTTSSGSSATTTTWRTAQAAVFLEGGWQDDNVKHWDTTQFFMALPDDHRKEMAIGQWDHSGSQYEDAQDLRHAWFDHWLLGFGTGIMELPPVDTTPFDGERVQETS